MVNTGSHPTISLEDEDIFHSLPSNDFKYLDIL